MLENAEILLMLYGSMGFITLAVLLIALFFWIWRSKCRIHIERNGKVEILETRFRIVKNKAKVEKLKTLKGGIKIRKPGESFFSYIGKNKLYVELAKSEAGTYHPIKPSFNWVNKSVKYDIGEDKAKQEYMEDMHEGIRRFEFRNKMTQLLTVGLPMLLILSMIIFSFFQWKVGQELTAQSQMSNANIENLANAVFNMDKTVTNNKPGGSNNPIPVNGGNG